MWRDRATKESNLNDFVTFVHNQLNEYEFIISYNSADSADVAVEWLHPNEQLNRMGIVEHRRVVNHFLCS